MILDRRGMTLSELLVSMFVMALLVGVLVSTYISAGRLTSQEQNRIEVDLAGSRLLAETDRLVRQAKAVEAQYPTSGSPTYTTNDTTLVFSMPSLVGGTPDTSTGKVDIGVLHLSGSDLLLTIDADPASDRIDETRTATTNVKDINFRYNTVTPSSAREVVTTIRTEKLFLTFPYTQITILHETLINHPS